MTTIVLVAVWFIALVNFSNNFAGWMAGNTFDYIDRRRTFHGTKSLFWAAVVILLWRTSWL